MCGIFGYIGHIEKHVAEKCTSTLSHRGPDGQGIFSTNDVALGHRRLSILDLSDRGRQPMSYANKRYWITYNGEIYNFLELRQLLLGKGYHFDSDSDSEVILASFIEWGAECQNKFNGMWAFGIWDDLNKSLFLSRDRFGIKPLFYSHLPNGNFVFASEMKAIKPLIDFPKPNIDLLRSTSGYMLEYESTDSTLLSNVLRLKAGHSAIYQQRTLKVQQWWNTLDHISEQQMSYSEHLEDLSEVLHDAVRIRLRSDAPTCTALSGGLDSSTISAIAASFKKHTVTRSQFNHQAYTASFKGTEHDEVVYAKAVADYCELNLNIIDIDPLQSLDNINKYYYLFEEIFPVLHIPHMLLYGAISKDGIKVSIDGHGADELFGGYTHSLEHAFKDIGLSIDNYRNLSSTLINCRPTYYDSKNHRAKNYLGRWISVQLSLAVSKFHKGSSNNQARHPNWQKLDFLTRELYKLTHETMLPTLLRNYDRYSMSSGVEIRMPFMDYRVVIKAFSLGWKSKIRNGYSKAIIRDIASKYLPRNIAYRRDKIGFGSPIYRWLRGQLKVFMLDAIQSSDFLNTNVMDPKLFTDNYRKFLKSETSSFTEAEILWGEFSKYLWEKNFLNHTDKVLSE